MTQEVNRINPVDESSSPLWQKEWVCWQYVENGTVLELELYLFQAFRGGELRVSSDWEPIQGRSKTFIYKNLESVYDSDQILKKY